MSRTKFYLVSLLILTFSVFAESTEVRGAAPSGDNKNVPKEIKITSTTATEYKYSENDKGSEDVRKVVTEKESDDKEEDSLGWDIFSYTISIEGIVFNIPERFGDFLDAGWEVEGNLPLKIAPDSETGTVYLKKGNRRINVRIINITSPDSISPSEASVVYLSIPVGDFKSDGHPNILLPGGITENSKREEVENAYGFPTSEKSTGTYSTVNYENNFGRMVSISFDSRDGSIAEISMTNPRNDGNVQVQRKTQSVSGEIPPEILNYVRPSSVSDDIFSHTLKVKDLIYKIPAPLSVFLEDGWRLINGPKTLKSMQEYTSGIYLMKDNKKVMISLKNYSDFEQNAENTWLTEISPDGYGFGGTNIEIEAAGGIKNGITEEELKKKIAGMKHEIYVHNDMAVYTIGETEYGLTEIIVDREQDSVVSILIKNVPPSPDE